ncbi:MAG: hypothetical protein ACLVLA_01995 [Acidaminococcus intestini]
MEDEALRMGRLIQNLRDLSLAEVGQLELHKEKGDLVVLIKKAVAMMAPLFEEKKLSVTLSLEDSLPDLLFDRDRMNQVIYNLLGNAVRYVPQGRALFISAVSQMDGKNAYLLTEIRDTGTAFRPISCCTFSSISTAVKPRGTARAAAAASALPWPVS